MHQQISNTIAAADRVRAATDLLLDQTDETAAAAYIAALDALNESTEALRRAPRMPSVRALWERRVTLEAIYMPAASFAPMDEGMAELVEELDDYGTTGVPRAITAATAEAIRRGSFTGVIGRVSMFRTEESRYAGVIAAEDLETFVARAAEWGAAVLKAYRQPLQLVAGVAHQPATVATRGRVA